MQRTTFQVGTFEVNCSVLYEGDRALVVDPGAEAALVEAKLKELRLEPAAILLTHAHFDHICAVNDIKGRHPGLPVFIGAEDAKIISHPFNQFPPDYPLVEGIADVMDAMDLRGFLASAGWNASVEVIETPGHTPGGVCYLFGAPAPLLMSGDTLFCGSVGRTDFPGGDMPTLQASLEKLKSLPGETIVVPGHGPETTIAHELASNPFLTPNRGFRL